MSPFLIILAISLSCLGLREVTDEVDQGRVGYPIRKWFIDQAWIPLWISKPLILCVTCMASFWGSIVFWLIIYHYNADNMMEVLKQWQTYGKWAFCCISAAFVNTLFWAFRQWLIGLL